MTELGLMTVAPRVAVMVDGTTCAATLQIYEV
jgi:hypothetical protein